MTDTTIIILLTSGLLIAVFRIEYQSRTIKRLKKELKQRIEATHPG